jgi:hypothetical protein
MVSRCSTNLCYNLLLLPPLRHRIPTGFKSISPGLAVRAGRRGAPTLGNRSLNSSTLKELNQIHCRTDATPSELSAIQSPTQRSPMASVNAGLNDTTPLELVGRSCCSALGLGDGVPSPYRKNSVALSAYSSTRERCRQLPSLCAIIALKTKGMVRKEAAKMQKPQPV